MNKIIYTFFLFTFSVFCTKATDIFTAAEKDPYTLASFSKERELEKILETPLNQSFIKAFENEFAADFDTEKQYENLKRSKIDDWEMHLFEQRNKQITFLKDNENFSRFSPEFQELVLTNINYNYWHLLLAYAINRSNENTGLRQVTSLPRIMTEAIQKDQINKPTRLISKSYRAFLPYFVIYFNSQNQGFEQYTDGVKSMTDKAQFAEKYLDGDVLDYTLTQLLSEDYPNLSTNSFRFWASQIYCENLRNYLNTNFFEAVSQAETERQKNKVTDKKKLDLPVLMDLEDKPFTFEKYKGKVIYVDFWASWCGPCRQQFPFSKALYESLNEKQKEEIVFLYISIDQEIEKWKAAVEKLGLNKSGENAHSFDVAIKYQVASIPRYMIIDQKGNLVNPNAPRPSNDETLGLLLELIN